MCYGTPKCVRYIRRSNNSEHGITIETPWQEIINQAGEQGTILNPPHDDYRIL